jgi:DNA-binding transcriptional LysR family regulator
MDLDLRLVRYAIAVADELHFGRAASRLMITEQTLSAQIKHLEARLGLILFERDRRPVRTTAAGQLLVERGRRLLADADDLMAEIARNPAPLRVDVFTEALETPGRLVEYLRASLPGVPLEIRLGQGLAASLPRLLSGELDLAFGRAGWGSQELPDSLGHALVRLEQIGVMLPVAHALASYDEVRVADLARVPMLIFASREAAEWQDWQEEFIREFDLRLSVVVHGQGVSAATGAVLSHGHPHVTSLTLPPLDGVVVRPILDPIPVYPWSIVWRTNRHDPRVDQCLALVREFIVGRRWLLPPERPWWTPVRDLERIG